MKRLILASLLLMFFGLSAYADTLTEFLKVSVGKKVQIYLKEKKDINDYIMGTLDKVDDKYITVISSPTGDYVIMRDAIATIYVYKK